MEKVRPASDPELAAVKRIYELVLQNVHIHGALLELANHSRHSMFDMLVRFVQDVAHNEIICGDADTSMDSFVLESYFYHWIIVNRVYDVSVYDIVHDTQEWQDVGHRLGCSFAHLIITAIYNLTHKVRGVHTYTSRTYVRDVIDRLSRLGFSPHTVREKMLNMYQQGQDHLGILEL